MQQLAEVMEQCRRDQGAVGSGLLGLVCRLQRMLELRHGLAVVLGMTLRAEQSDDIRNIEIHGYHGSE